MTAIDLGALMFRSSLIEDSKIEDCLSFATIKLPTIVLNEEGDHFVAATPKVFDYETIKYQYTNMIETNQPITISCYIGENVVGDQTKVSFTHFMVLSRTQWEQLGCKSLARFSSKRLYLMLCVFCNQRTKGV